MSTLPDSELTESRPCCEAGFVARPDPCPWHDLGTRPDAVDDYDESLSVMRGIMFGALFGALLVLMVFGAVFAGW